MSCRNNDTTNRTANTGYCQSDGKLLSFNNTTATATKSQSSDLAGGGGGNRHRRSTIRRQFRFCFKFSAFIFSHIGLGFLVLAYTIIGAFLFKHFEESNAGQRSIRIAEIRNHTVNRLWTETYKLNVLYKENWTAMAVKEIEQFQRSLIAAIKDGNDGWMSVDWPPPPMADDDGTNDNDQRSANPIRWSFVDSWMYSISIITTIGYANRPLTAEGKITTMIYALFGIPIMLLFLSTIGALLGRGLKFLYQFCCSCSTTTGPMSVGSGMHHHDTAAFINLQSSHDDHLHHLHDDDDDDAGGGGGGSMVHHIAMNNIGADHHHQHRTSMMLAGLVDSTGTLTKPVANNIAAGTGKKTFTGLNHSFHHGLYGATPANCLCDKLPDTATLNHHYHHNSLCSPNKLQLYTGVQPQLSPAAAVCHCGMTMVDHREDFDDGHGGGGGGGGPPPPPDGNVPFYFCFFLITLYIIGGSLMFHIWEGLPFLDGAYFCFVTLSTIGFGDILPEKTLMSSSSSESKKRIIIIVIYILGGMTLVAMSFNIIYEQLAFKFKKIGYRVRLQQRREEEEEADSSSYFRAAGGGRHPHHHHHLLHYQQHHSTTDFGSAVGGGGRTADGLKLSPSVNKFPSNEDIDV